MPTETTLFRLLYGKVHHLPAFWSLKTSNLDLKEVGRLRLSQLNELEELRLDAYENSLISKERTKKWSDSRLKDPKEFMEGDRVLLFNSRFRLFFRKLKSKWSRRFIVRKVYSHGAVDLVNSKGE
ncbi:uncharacterized protein [Rutidosis leptorrhynchoides]|uniref:uncharacterized protein n=1 Tax=Rutidosis leptorrhynchoides TaxID=125765 RepID=UPI003A99D5B2